MASAAGGRCGWRRGSSTGCPSAGASTSHIVSGSGADRVPHVHGEDQRVAARVVVEDHLGRRVGEDAAVPVELAVDAHGRERRRQRARRHDVLDADLHVAAVEVAHLAGAHVRGADGQPRLAAVDEREIDQLGQRLLQRRGRVVAGALGAERRRACPRTPSGWARRSRGCRAPSCSSRTAPATAAARPPTPCQTRLVRHAVPERLQPRPALSAARCRRSGWR